MKKFVKFEFSIYAKDDWQAIRSPQTA